jgi:HD-GYP domain-containing protein (c-di-GMP phosphodiesterase class II)
MNTQDSSLRLAELIGALSHALDITEGQPRGHALRCCWIGMTLGNTISLSQTELSDLYYTILLKDLGCSSTAARVCELYMSDDIAFKNEARLMPDRLPDILRFIVRHTGPDLPMVKRLQTIMSNIRNGSAIANELFEARCFRGADIARQMRFSDAVCAGIAHLDEHWDGSGRPDHLRGDAIPLPSQISLLSQVVDVFHTAGGPDSAVAEVLRKRGTWFAPKLVDAFLVVAKQALFWTNLVDSNLRQKILTLEPIAVQRHVDEAYLDDIALAFAKVVDAKSPFTAGHSERVAAYAVLTAHQLGENISACRMIKRAALLHDIGKLGVSNTILDKPAKLTDAEYDVVKKHPIYSGEILSGFSAFADLAEVGLSHHERLDGRGYPQGLKGDQISMPTRIVTVADVFDALTAERPYRAAMPPQQAFAIMSKDLGAAFDPDCYAALCKAMEAAAAA